MAVDQAITSRLTVVEQVYYQREDSDLQCTENGFSRDLDTDEQQYVRGPMGVGEKWEKLDTGWVEEVAMIVVRNNEGEGLKLQPTEEEKEESAKKIIELSLDSDIRGGVWLVPPGESFRGYPSNSSIVYIRCQYGETKFTITAIPNR